MLSPACRATIALVIVTATPLAAQKRSALFGMGGYYIASDIYAGTNVNNKVQLDDAWTYGGRLAVFPQPHFGVELSYARAVSDVSTTNSSILFGDPGNKGNVTLDQIDLSGLYSSERGPASGYLSLGLGTTVVTPHIPNAPSNDNWRFAWNFGLGAMFQAGQALVGRLDARARALYTNRTTGGATYCDGFGYCYGYVSSIYWSGEVTAGLGIRF